MLNCYVIIFNQRFYLSFDWPSSEQINKKSLNTRAKCLKEKKSNRREIIQNNFKFANHNNSNKNKSGGKAVIRRKTKQNNYVE